MKRFLLLLSLTIFVVLHSSAWKKDSLFVDVNGQKRNMIVFTPKVMQDNMPLFIVTHGMNQNPEYQYGSDKLYEMIDTAKFVVTYLRSNGNTWDTGGTNDQTFVTKAIDDMATRFNIDKDRVYWSGFSMGSMLIHHCIANMRTKIAAFAPTSGIQFSEQPWNNCGNPLNLLEVIAYDDNVFGYEQYGIHDYIENYAKHAAHKKYSKTIGYKARSTNWQNGDLEKWTGSANGGEVWLYSYNNGGHWPSDQNRFLIWDFCKRFSLNQPTARIALPAGEMTHLYMGPKDEASFPDVTVKAAGKVYNSSKVEKVEIYDGKTLIDTANAVPFQTTLTAPAVGNHNLRVVITDSKGKSGEGSCLLSCLSKQTSYTFSTRFKVENCVPQDWYVSNGSTKRAGGGLSFTDGCRALRFTNSSKAFEYGILVQNATGKAKAAFAKFGTSNARSTMTLHSGHYLVKYKVCNWNQPDFTPVTVAIEKTDGQEVASMVYTPTVNLNNSTANKFSASLQSFEFDIPESGDYVLAFYADAAKNADFVLGTLTIQAKTFTTDIQEVANPETKALLQRSDAVYDLSGRRVEGGQKKHGIYIQGGRKVIY